jgi:hypothetical protein
MDTLLTKFGPVVNGVITGFDRIVYKGICRAIMYAEAMELFLTKRKILYKDYKNYAMAQSQILISSAEELGEITYIPSLHTRKEALAHKRQKEKGITEGLIGVWSCLESCRTFRSTFDGERKYPSLRNDSSRCKHLYFYFDDPVYGFMSVRLQTWAPYEIQIALNGREWLRRSLDAAGCKYILHGNKFLYIEDYALAQELLDAQSEANLKQVLQSFLPIVFPRMQEVVGDAEYHWSYWQSEVARDYIFSDCKELDELMNDLQLHAMITGNGERILKYFGAPVKDGQPHKYANPELVTRLKTWHDGFRIRHWYGSNSVKCYNEQNVLRIETTINDPRKFKVNRHTENQDKTGKKKRLRMRKGIADTTPRVETSKDIINRFSEHLASAENKTRLGELITGVNKPLKRKGKRIRALDVYGKDRELLCAIADPIYTVSGFTNKDLQKSLGNTPWANKMTGKQLSGKISRHLSLLRQHGLIRKLPKQRRYTLTKKGQKLITAIQVAFSASVQDLLRMTA